MKYVINQSLLWLHSLLCQLDMLAPFPPAMICHLSHDIDPSHMASIEYLEASLFRMHQVVELVDQIKSESAGSSRMHKTFAGSPA